MLSLPQNITEQLLEKELNRLGTQVQRGCELVDFLLQDDQVVATIKSVDNEQQVQCDYLLGADGAHSFVRKKLGIQFIGKDYPEEWHLVDLDMQWAYGDQDGQAFLTKDATVMVALPIGDNRFRLICNQSDFSSLLPSGTMVNNVYWQSQFKVYCRIVESYQQGRVFLMGDAAHIHSPVGGRGMNLGIEDAFTFVNLLEQGRLADYTELRHKVGFHVLNSTDLAFRNLKTPSKWKMFVRNYILFPLVNLPFVQKKLLWDVAGLH